MSKKLRKVYSIRAFWFSSTLVAMALGILMLVVSQQTLVEAGSPPAKPAVPTVASVSHNSVSITWTDPGDSSITGYRVLRRNPAIHEQGEFVVIEDDTGSSDTSYTDTDVEPETRYVYRVRARNSHGLSERSSYVSATTLAEPDLTPATPAQPTVASVSHDSVSITWTDPGDSSITGYQVLRRNPAIHEQGEFVVIEDDTGSSNTSYEDTDVESETRYVYRVRARNAHGLSDRSRVAKTTTPADPTPANSAATGQPTITGTAQVGATLSADTSGISDTNGLTGVQYTYQWVRNDGDTDADISGATGQTYTLTTEDKGNTVKVRVSFTDDDGYSETLTSASTGAVVRPANSAATGQPTITGTAQVGETLSADTSGISDANGLTGVEYTYQWLRTSGGTDADISGATGQTYTLTSDDQDNTVKVRVSFPDADGDSETLTSAASETVARPANSAATGQPTITGTAQVGETLSADTSGISDANGLTGVQYIYQWVGNDGNADTDITGATRQTYTLTSDDQGNTVKVSVSFTDDDGYSETLTSAATDAVTTLIRVNPPGIDPPVYRQQQQTPANSRATGLPTISGTAHVGETLTAGTSNIRDANGLTNVSYTYRWASYNDSSQLYEYISGATSSTYTLTASHVGTSFRVNVSFTDDDGYSESKTSNPTFDVVAPADAQTGGTFVSETQNSDFAATTSTTGQVSVGGEPRLRRILSTVRGVTGWISPQNDKDWYKIALEGGKNYRIAVLGRDNGNNRTLIDTRIFGVYNSSGNKISGTSNDNSVRSEARVYYQPGSDGNYYISVGGGGVRSPDTGSYQLIVQEVPVDVSANTSTTGTITATTPSAEKVPVSGEIDKKNDVDWYKLTATANKGYIINMAGGAPSHGDHSDVMIDGVYDADGDFISGTRNNDAGDILGNYKDARSSFVATTAGSYFIAVKGSVPSGTDTGSYELWVTEVAPSALND